MTPTPLLRALRPIAATVLLLAAGAACAHGLVLTAQGEGTHVSGQVRYSDNTPAVGIFVEVRATEGDGPPLAEASTDAEGRFRLPAPATRPLRVIAEGEEGHRAEVVAHAVPLVVGGTADTDAAVATLRLLREDISRLESRIRLQDVIGGIGYIVGIAGIAAWLAARRRK